MREVRNPSCRAVERRDGHVAVLAVHRPEAADAFAGLESGAEIGAKEV